MPGYHVKQERIAVAGVPDLLIRSLLDRQQFSDPLGVAERAGIGSAEWPLFGLPWPSGLQLAMRLAARNLKPGERILEMGCGLALASLVAHRRGADVTASDKHPLAQLFLDHNLRLNDLAPMAYRNGEWALPDAGQPALPGGVHGRFDLLIGSDLLYERGSGPLLAAFIGRHALPAAEVWIVDPDRGNRPAFNRAMRGLGFGLLEQRLDQGATALRQAYKGRLLSYRR